MAFNPKEIPPTSPIIKTLGSIRPPINAINMTAALEHVCARFSELSGTPITFITNEPCASAAEISVALPNVSYTPSNSKTADLSVPFTLGWSLLSSLAGTAPAKGQSELPKFHAQVQQSDGKRLEILKAKKTEFVQIGIGSESEINLALAEMKNVMAVNKAAIDLLPADYPIGKVLFGMLNESMDEFVRLFKAAPLVDESFLSSGFGRIGRIALLTVICKKRLPSATNLQVRIGRQLSDMAKWKTGIDANAQIWEARGQEGFRDSISESASRGSKPEIVMEEIRVQILEMRRMRSNTEELEVQQEINLRSRQLLQIYNCLFNYLNALYDICSLAPLKLLA
ncbi:MAG TPA: hypothetical protein VMD02_03470 [Candidatus Omnitrophota bacterium]|nr:hypothetical protein [Candidatus Omnitrophota bacterium]